MNTIWSDYIQGANTLHHSRKLRFHDLFANQYKALFSLDENAELKILEVGCGTGALAEALHKWYPNAEIVAIDRDSSFIEYAKHHVQNVTFVEGDATDLPFEDESFDVVISNTVCEHIEPDAFYGEQRRVLKQNGVCLVLSSRKGIKVEPYCYAQCEYEKNFWCEAEKHDDSIATYEIGKYSTNEAQMPAIMQKYGFKNIDTGYAIIDLTLDSPKYSPEFARSIIDADRYCEIESVESVAKSMPDLFSKEQIDKMKKTVNAKFDNRAMLYDSGKKLWDTTVCVIMVLRGLK